ncbi:FadR family transcriptional regulator [Solitalea sp. MAHUQ-68]|uniref:FadR family transcriptional regulator n=1 Tax=Solitalea agri TaxID=2953739 RepID=A0A9X2JB27_9SPHI|nr:FadR/GntR family transcriptional regulator [Solitalea agri]MCO4292042.1 FadR family transcriptional regulator [Solitalea agri]
MSDTIIKRKSLADEVADRIKKLICSGDYMIGDKLPTEPELMQKFGVGRSSIREAVKILTQKGMLRVQQGTGTFVASLSGSNGMLSNCLEKARYEEVNEVRFLLEEKIVEKAALNRTDADIERIRESLLKRKHFAESGDVAGCIQADIDFHTAIAEAAQNSILLELYQTVANHMKKALAELHKNTQAFIDSQAIHEALLQAIIDKKEKRAINLAENISKHK